MKTNEKLSPHYATHSIVFVIWKKYLKNSITEILQNNVIVSKLLIFELLLDRKCVDYVVMILTKRLTVILPNSSEYMAYLKPIWPNFLTQQTTNN